MWYNDHMKTNIDVLNFNFVTDEFKILLNWYNKILDRNNELEQKVLKYEARDLYLVNLLKQIQKMSGPNSHRVGCQCGGVIDSMGTTCKIVWDRLDYTLKIIEEDAKHGQPA